jgi:hypothetical protein
VSAVPPIDPQDLKTLKARWARVGPILEDIRQREFLALTEAERFAEIAAVLSLVPRNQPPRLTSGLVEMRRRLRRSCTP